MKYIISESRLENMVELYLDSIFEPHEIVLVKIGFTRIVAERIYWVVNDVVVGEIQKYRNGDIKFWISTQMFNMLSSMFSLTIPSFEHHIKKYFREKHNINFVNVGVHDFEFSQEWYDTHPHEKISL